MDDLIANNPAGEPIPVKPKRKNRHKRIKKGGPNRKARLIVRNISFKASEEELQKYFSQFGQIDDFNLLKRPDGTRVGCGFVQYRTTQMAAKAVHRSNGQQFMNRPIIVDWAVPKNHFINNVDDAKVKEEKCEPDDIQQSTAAAEENDIKIKSEDETEPINQNESDSEESDSDSEEKSEDEDESDEDDVKIETEEPHSKKFKRESNDVTEGRTVFIKNVPFEATNEDLKSCMLQFGRVFYALICKDPFTEHSKGTAFVKFINVEDAEKCLQAGTELTLLGQVLDCYKAEDRNSIKNKSKKDEKVKDARNLYLLREGVIIAGTPAAEGVSKSDMEKRLQLEQWKSQMLRNLNMFVSRVRLVVHNLPPTWDDQKLKNLCIKYGGPKAHITEAKIMRNLRNVNGEGIGSSKEFGFVTFSNHENALTALRTLNNNPNIFTSSKRPVVAFSIENKSMLNAKQKRLQKSRLRNPLCKDFDPSDVKKANEKQENRKTVSVEDTEENFVGIKAKPGVEQKMRSRYKLKMQSSIHSQQLKNKKREMKMKKQKQIARLVPTKDKKQKQSKKKDADDKFSKLVNRYKSHLSVAPLKTSKWYE